MNALCIEDDCYLLSSLRPKLSARLDYVSLVAVGSASHARRVLMQTGSFDFIFIDLHLHNGNAFELLAELRCQYQFIPFIATSESELRADAIRAIYLGATSYVPRRSGTDGLLAAMRAACGQFDARPFVRARTQALKSELPYLTPRQLDVAALLMQGQSNKAIARTLNLSVDTVKDHVTALMRNLNVNSRTQAALACSGVNRKHTFADGRTATFGRGHVSSPLELGRLP